MKLTRSMLRSLIKEAVMTQNLQALLDSLEGVSQDIEMSGIDYEDPVLQRFMKAYDEFHDLVFRLSDGSEASGGPTPGGEYEDDVSSDYGHG